MVRSRRLRLFFAVALVVVLLPAFVLTPGAVAGIDPSDTDTRPEKPLGPDPDTGELGTTVVVPAGETTTGSVTASGARVIVAGRHEGDLKLYGGTVVVAGTVTGDVQAFGATVRVTGTVGGSLVAYGGTVELADSARIGELFNTGGSRVLVNGTVNSSVQATGGKVILGDSATVARELTYDATLVDRGGSVAGDVTRTDRFLGPVGTLLRGLEFLPILAPLLGLIAGLAGRRWLPTTAVEMSKTLADDPGRSILSGVGGLLATGVLALLLGVSVVGLPLVVVLGCLAGLGALLGLAITQSAVGRVVLGRVASDRRDTGVAHLVGAGVALLVGLPAVVGVVPSVALGLLAAASVGGVGALVVRTRENDDLPSVPSRFG